MFTCTKINVWIFTARMANYEYTMLSSCWQFPWSHSSLLFQRILSNNGSKLRYKEKAFSTSVKKVTAAFSLYYRDALCKTPVFDRAIKIAWHCTNIDMLRMTELYITAWRNLWIIHRISIFYEYIAGDWGKKFGEATSSMHDQIKNQNHVTRLKFRNVIYATRDIIEFASASPQRK